MSYDQLRNPRAAVDCRAGGALVYIFPDKTLRVDVPVVRWQSSATRAATTINTADENVRTVTTSRVVCLQNHD